MSILGNRGGNAQDKQPAPLPAHLVRGPGPTLSAQPPSPADPKALHPAALAHAAAWSDMCQELDRLRTQVQHMTNQLIVERENSQQKDMALDFERRRVVESDRWRETCQRFAVEIHKGITDGLALIEGALKRAAEIARTIEPQPLDRVEAEAKKAVEAAMAEAPPEPEPQ